MKSPSLAANYLLSDKDITLDEIESLHDLQIVLDKYVPDLRNHYKIEYCTSTVLTVALLARIGGITRAEDVALFWKANADWIDKNILYSNGSIPCPSTISYVLSKIDHEQLQRLVLLRFSERYALAEKIPGFDAESLLRFRILDADGQTVTSTMRSNPKKNGKRDKGFDIVTIMDASAKVTLIQLIVDKKNQESKSILTMIDELNLDNSILTFDAINTKRDLLQAINYKYGHFVTNLKRNNKLTFEEAETAFDKLLSLECLQTWPGQEHAIYAEYNEKSGSDVVYKTLHALPAEDVFSEEVLSKWDGTGLCTVIRVTTWRYNKFVEDKDQTKPDVLYFISNLPIVPNSELKASDKIRHFKNQRAKELLEVIRRKWGVETMHQHLDNPRIFDQDRHRIFRYPVLKANSIINKFSLNILETVRKETVVMHQNGVTYRNDRLPMTRLVKYASHNPEIALSYLKYYFNKDKTGLIEFGLHPPAPKKERVPEILGPQEFIPVNDEDQKFALASIFAKGGGRRRFSP